MRVRFIHPFFILSVISFLFTIHGYGQKTTSKVVLIGIDAADWTVINPLIEEGKLPTFQKLKQSSFTGGLKSVQPISSPVIWTTIATGLTPNKHKISGYVNDIGLIRITDRKVPAVWDILSHHKKTVGVISWLGLWPAEKTYGVTISDYLYLVPREGKPRMGSIVYPDRFVSEVYSQIITPANLTDSEISKFIQMKPGHSMTDLKKKYANQIKEFSWAYAQDESVLRYSMNIYKKTKPTFFTFYLRGVDSICHKFWYHSRFNKNKVPWNYSDEEKNIFAGMVENYYIYTDDLLNRFLKIVDKNSIIIIVSDHGYGAVERGDITTAHTDTGIILVSAPYNRKNIEIRNSRVEDITPTILAMMNIPLDKEMDGKPLIDVINPSWLKKHPVRYIDSYKKLGLGRTEHIPKKSPVDEEVKERLRSLGYIQ